MKTLIIRVLSWIVAAGLILESAVMAAVNAPILVVIQVVRPVSQNRFVLQAIPPRSAWERLPPRDESAPKHQVLVFLSGNRTLAGKIDNVHSRYRRKMELLESFSPSDQALLQRLWNAIETSDSDEGKAFNHFIQQYMYRDSKKPLVWFDVIEFISRLRLLFSYELFRNMKLDWSRQGLDQMQVFTLLGRLGMAGWASPDESRSFHFEIDSRGPRIEGGALAFHLWCVENKGMEVTETALDLAEWSGLSEDEIPVILKLYRITPLPKIRPMEVLPGTEKYSPVHDPHARISGRLGKTGLLWVGISWGTFSGFEDEPFELELKNGWPILIRFPQRNALRPFQFDMPDDSLLALGARGKRPTPASINLHRWAFLHSNQTVRETIPELTAWCGLKDEKAVRGIVKRYGVATNEGRIGEPLSDAARRFIMCLQQNPGTKDSITQLAHDHGGVSMNWVSKMVYRYTTRVKASVGRHVRAVGASRRPRGGKDTPVRDPESQKRMIWVRVAARRFNVQMSDAEDIVQGAVAQKLEKQRGKVENTEVLLSRLDLRPAYRRGIAASRRTRGPSLSNPFTEILASEARYRSAPTVEDQLIRQEERQRVRCALESLTDNERRLLEPYLREDGDAHDLKFHTTGVTDQEVDSLRKQAAQAFRAAYLTLINLPNRLPPVPREPVQDKTKILRLAA